MNYLYQYYYKLLLWMSIKKERTFTRALFYPLKFRKCVAKEGFEPPRLNLEQ